MASATHGHLRMQASKERVPLSLGFVGLWLLHNCGDTVHSLLDEVLREACPASVPPRAATMGHGPVK